MIGIIGAMDIEVDGINDLMEAANEKIIGDMRFFSGNIFGIDCVTVVCGVGKVNAAVCAQTMINLFSPDIIINSGVAGALKGGIDIGDIVVASDVLQHDFDLTPMGAPRGAVPVGSDMILNIECDRDTTAQLIKSCEALGDVAVFNGTVATGDQFIEGKEKRRELFESFGAFACEMEGGAIGQVCCKNNVPFAVLRAISDNIDKDDFLDFAKFAEEAAARSIKAISGFLKAKAMQKD